MPPSSTLSVIRNSDLTCAMHRGLGFRVEVKGVAKSDPKDAENTPSARLQASTLLETGSFRKDQDSSAAMVNVVPPERSVQAKASSSYSFVESPAYR